MGSDFACSSAGKHQQAPSQSSEACSKEAEVCIFHADTIHLACRCMKSCAAIKFQETLHSRHLQVSCKGTGAWSCISNASLPSSKDRASNSDNQADYILMGMKLLTIVHKIWGMPPIAQKSFNRQ